MKNKQIHINDINQQFLDLSTKYENSSNETEH